MNAMSLTNLGDGRLLAAAAAPAAPDPEPAPHGPEPVPSYEPEPAPPPRRGGGLLALLALLAGAGLGAWLYQSPAEIAGVTSGGGGAGFFRTVSATTGELRETLRVGGNIRAEEYAAIRAPQIRTGSRSGGGGGSMTLIAMADAGAFVRKGDVIAEFDRQSQQQQIDDQQANVVQAQAMVKVRQADLMIELETKRQERVAAKSEYEKAKLDLRTAPVKSAIEAEVLRNLMQEAEATYEQLDQEVKMVERAQEAALRQVEIDLEQERIDLERAEINVRHMLLTAPIDGAVVHETVFNGGTFAQVANGDEVRPGSMFMQIVNPASMVLEGQVNQADSQKVRIGQRAEVRLDAYPGEVFDGVVSSVSAMAGAGGSSGRFRSGSGDHVRQIAVTIDILDQDPRIIPDLSASADVILEAHENVVTAPREALDRSDGGYFVWVRSAGKGAERRPVKLGRFNDTHAVVLEGLAGDETLEVRIEDAAGLSRR